MPYELSSPPFSLSLCLSFIAGATQKLRAVLCVKNPQKPNQHFSVSVFTSKHAI